MVPADSFEHILLYLELGGPNQGPWMCGLLFAPPASPIGKSIFDRLLDWHYRSGDNIDFFCVGYGNWSEDPRAKPVANLTAKPGLTPIDFYYNPRAFQEIRKQVEALSGWHYSGEADLLLLNAIKDPDTGQARLEFDEMVALDVDRLIRENVFSTPARLLERICQAADEAATSGDRLSVMDFSDKEVMRTFARGALSKLVSTLKVDTLLGARHFIVGGHFLRV